MTGVVNQKSFRRYFLELFYICNFNLVNLKATRVETLFVEMKYIELQLRMLGM